MDGNRILEHVIGSCKKAGQFIQAEAGRFDRSHIEYKRKNDLVSYVDKHAEKLLVEELKTFLPEAGFITEEGTNSNRGERYNWVVDPLDGTTNFAHGFPAYCVSVALIEQKPDGSAPRGRLGVVYDPARDECFYALRNEGAFCNGNPIQVSSVYRLEDCLMAMGFPYYDFNLLNEYVDLVKNFVPKIHGFRRVGSAAIDLVYVACGRFEGFFDYNLNPWDVAAGAVIVQEAGGIVTDFKGTPEYLSGRQILAGNQLHPQMKEIISRFRDKF